MKTVLDFLKKKEAHENIVMVTCYDATFAELVRETAVDCVLVGDSAGMVMLGHKDTTRVTLEEMRLFTHAVARGLCGEVFLIADLPFMSYRASLTSTVRAVTKLIRAGAMAVKCEGAAGNVETIRHIVQSGVPVMGHLGLTPQHIHALGGFKRQGTTQDAQASLKEQARALEEAGCFSLVLECVPSHLAEEISACLTIPTIGIGAGPKTDGQVLVLQDLLGLQTRLKVPFVKTYMDGASLVVESLNHFAREVREDAFPLDSSS